MLFYPVSPRVTTTTRPPQSVPLVLQQMKAAPPDSTANPLNMSGLGRGRSPMVGATETSMPNGVSPLGVNQVYNENSILLEALARGRGIGRGILTVGKNVLSMAKSVRGFPVIR